MANFKELVLLENDGDRYLAILPTSVTRAGDIARVGGELYKVLKTEWIDIDGPTYQMITAAYTPLVPDEILRKKWEKEALTNADP